MTKSFTTRVGSLSRARPLLTPFVILPLNNDNTFNNHEHKHLRVRMHKSGARDAPRRRHADTLRSRHTRHGAPAPASAAADPRMRS